MYNIELRLKSIKLKKKKKQNAKKGFPSYEGNEKINSKLKEKNLFKISVDF